MSTLIQAHITIAVVMLAAWIVSVIASYIALHMGDDK